MKLYTKAGDKGETGLIGGGRVGKDSLRVEAYGEIDELNALIGLARAFNPHPQIDEALEMVQEHLFELGADLASPGGASRISERQVMALERAIDEVWSRLARLEQFILPGGSRTASLIHVARAVCRRAERRVVALSRREAVNPEALKYLNRLSDMLFTLARFVNKLESVPEKVWRPG